MDLYVLALTTEPGQPHAWLDENAPRQWLTVGVWTFDEPPVVFPPTIPCLVPASARDRLHLADCEDKPFGQWIITKHKVDRLELRHWRKVAFTQAPLPCGGVFPWERVQFRVANGIADVAAAFVVGPHEVRGDLLVVGPEDALKRVVTGVNEPSPPFETAYRIDLQLDFNRFGDDERRAAAELWCCHNTRRRWFRRILTDIGIARFEFEDMNEATMFRMAN